MTKYASGEELWSSTEVEDGAEDVPLPGGKVVRVRGLSRFELMANGMGTEDSALIERRNVAACLVEPKMTVAQVEQWQKRSKAGGAFRVLSTKIRDLSGVAEGADKSDV